MIDLLVVRKDSLGNVMTTTASDLDFEEATEFGSYVGSLAGYKSSGEAGLDYGAIAGAAELADGHVFDEQDVFRVTQSLPIDTRAAATSACSANVTISRPTRPPAAHTDLCDSSRFGMMVVR